ncbi:hypothetical protein [Bacillus weihaiensis]|uniref:hypothetical protein n=1 Tax=Bacillus weihaiensis TaxID=1547283 RepID=UPI0023538C60|nr:hypothetical protein [Bacillus weihaiensis]
MARAKKEVTEEKDLELQQAEEQENTEETKPVEEVETVEETPEKKYVVVHDFRDLEDGNTIYIKGDIYPRRADSIVDEDRIKELSSTKNKLGRVLIQEQE